MGKYRKIDPKIWNDAKFRALSERGKLVFLFTLTHPHMTALGAMRETIPGLASEYGISEEAFREAFQEASQKGMVEIDEVASFICLPKFIFYNKPESPNVLISWASVIDLLPECDLRIKHLQRVKAFAEGLPKGFTEVLPEAFTEALPKDYAKGASKPIPNREQEQEQEQDKEEGSPPETPEPKKEVKWSPPPWIPSDLWKEFKKYRTTIKAPLTELASKLLVADLVKLKDQGQDIRGVINQTIKSGKWKGFFEVHGDNGKKPLHQEPGPTRQEIKSTTCTQCGKRQSAIGLDGLCRECYGVTPPPAEFTKAMKGMFKGIPDGQNEQDRVQRLRQQARNLEEDEQIPI